MSEIKQAAPESGAREAQGASPLPDAALLPPDAHLPPQETAVAPPPGKHSKKKKKKPKVPLGQRLRNLTKIRISVRVGDEEAPPAPDPVSALGEAEADMPLGDPAPAPSAGDILFGVTETGREPDMPPATGDKKEKKKKVPKKKTAKRAKKKPAKKKSKAAAHGEKGSSRKVVLIVCVCLAVIGAGSAAAAILLSRSVGSPEDMLARAEKLTGQGKFEQAIELYGRVIDEGELAADAYLGMADTFETAEDAEAALPRLEAGYVDTGDERLLARYEEIAGTRPELGPSGNEQAAPANLPIRWQDPAFEEMVRRAMGIPAGQDIYQSDLSAVTTLRILGNTHAAAACGDESSGIANRNDVDSYEVNGVVYTERGDIRSLADVANFQNLTRLTVAYNRVESVDGVQQLPRLRMLALYANEIEDLSPLEGMESLRWLYLFNNHIGDISPLASLSALEGLSLQYNQVADLTPLASLFTLEELFMSNNQIADIAPLAALTNLRFIFLQNNEVANISVVASLPGLTDIDFTDNPVADYTPAAHVRNVNRTVTYPS